MMGGKSTPMPSLQISLPKHVTARPRADGTYRVLFEVRRDRPQDWPSTIPLPLTGRRRGRLDDADEVARIIADAEKLAERLDRARRGGEADASRDGADTLPAIAALWQASWTPEKGPPPIRPRTQEFYRKSLRILITWARRPKNRDRPMRSLTLPVIVAFLDTYADRPAQRGALKRTLSALFSFAMIKGAGGVTAHPFGVAPRLNKRRKKRAVTLWAQADVATAARVAAETALPFADGARAWAAGGRLIELMWETSADQTDVVTWRRDQHFRDGAQPAIAYARGKTGEEIVVPISHALAAKLRGCGALYFVTDPAGAPYKADDVHDDNRRGGHYRLLQDAIEAAGGRRLLLDHLRHSAITDAIEKGAPLGHVPSLSGHRGTAMIEQIYAQLTERQALAVQKARGIVE